MLHLPAEINHKTSPEPEISVIVPAYNAQNSICLLFERLLSQVYPLNQCEFIFVDNGSTDNTTKAILFICQEAQKQNLKFRHVVENHIQSSYAARNQGIRCSKGKILAFTDVDCYPQPTWIADIVKLFGSLPDVGLIGGAIVAAKGQTLIEKYSSRKQILHQARSGSHAFLPYASTANLSVRREVFEQVGLFRPYLTTGGDADFCWRVQQGSEWQLYITEQAVVEHKHRQSLRGLRAQFRRYGKSHKYLEELYQRAIFPPSITHENYLQSWKKWIIKDMPSGIKRILLKKGNLLDLLVTPLDLLVAREEMLGRSLSSLPENGHHIESLDSSLEE